MDKVGFKGTWGMALGGIIVATLFLQSENQEKERKKKDINLASPLSIIKKKYRYQNKKELTSESQNSSKFRFNEEPIPLFDHKRVFTPAEIEAEKKILEIPLSLHEKELRNELGSSRIATLMLRLIICGNHFQELKGTELVQIAYVQELFHHSQETWQTINFALSTDALFKSDMLPARASLLLLAAQLAQTSEQIDQVKDLMIRELVENANLNSNISWDVPLLAHKIYLSLVQSLDEALDGTLDAIIAQKEQSVRFRFAVQLQDRFPHSKELLKGRLV